MRNKLVKKSHPVAIRFDNDVKDALEAVATAEDRSVSYVVNRVCRLAMENSSLGMQQVAPRASGKRDK